MPLRVIKGVLFPGPRARSPRWSSSRTASSSARSRRPRIAASRARPAQRSTCRQRARPARGARRADAEPARLRPRRRDDDRGDRAASARAATKSRSASPSTTRCATARRWSRSCEPRSRVLLDRLVGERPRRAAEIVAAGVEPLRELIGAMHSKMLLAELRSQRARPGGSALRTIRAPPALPARAVVLHHAAGRARAHAAGQGAGERAERRAVVAADEQQVVAARASASA